MTSISKHKAMKFLLISVLLLPFAGIAQTKTWYNWKGFPLEVFERPDIKSRQIGSIAGGGKVEVAEFSRTNTFPVYLCYYGDTVTTRVEQYSDNEKHVYTLKSEWAKVVYNNKEGYVPAAFLVHIPLKPIHKKKTSDEYSPDLPVIDALKEYLGKPLSYKKHQLEKQDKDEIHFSESYSFSGGYTYKAVQQYMEEGGAGGETHTLFLPSFSLHEAVLFLLELQNAGTYRPDEVKSFNKLKSSYDYFRWWYQPVNYDDEGNEVKAAGIYNFQYNSEGGGSGVKFTQKKGGVEVEYSFGGC
ncbi:hypothetical protein U0035_17115 [Niabella yanshanensis]|uniref:SH3 domain-containing protein n=1 Tax=Niabella yanshanensis TaxID=577386 RepID=A0ABZ0W5N5_9BACT|nr:hypothetical protein [Niabella yanshanensis]WQD37391.1 hypothetical protein U0035_17115 [Niabella yanshanensis]